MECDDKHRHIRYTARIFVAFATGEQTSTM